MGFWGDFFKNLFKPVVKEVTSTGLESLAVQVKLEIDENEDLKPAEKELLKTGVDLLVERAAAEVTERVS